MHLFMRWNDYKAFFSSLTFELPVALAMYTTHFFLHRVMFHNMHEWRWCEAKGVFSFRVILGETIWHYTILSLHSFIFLPFFFCIMLHSMKKKTVEDLESPLLLLNHDRREQCAEPAEQGDKISDTLGCHHSVGARLCNIFQLQSSFFFCWLWVPIVMAMRTTAVVAVAWNSNPRDKKKEEKRMCAQCLHAVVISALQHRSVWSRLREDSKQCEAPCAQHSTEYRKMFWIN